MNTLLIHALKSEAGILRQHFSQAKKIILQSGIELIGLNPHYDLLRIGVGPDQTQTALKQISKPGSYDRIIHFGVSGSLDEHIPIDSLVSCHRFYAEGQPFISMKAFPDSPLPNLRDIGFYSSLDAITDETSRALAATSGAGAVDMESYWVAKFCQANHLPLLALRCISDRAGDSTPEDFRLNYKYAAQKLQEYLLDNFLKPVKV